VRAPSIDFRAPCAGYRTYFVCYLGQLSTEPLENYAAYLVVSVSSSAAKAGTTARTCIGRTAHLTRR
jgi:hypothetical protein